MTNSLLQQPNCMHAEDVLWDGKHVYKILLWLTSEDSDITWVNVTIQLVEVLTLCCIYINFHKQLFFFLNHPNSNLKLMWGDKKENRQNANNNEVISDSMLMIEVILIEYMPDDLNKIWIVKVDLAEFP